MLELWVLVFIFFLPFSIYSDSGFDDSDIFEFAVGDSTQYIEHALGGEAPVVCKHHCAANTDASTCQQFLGSNIYYPEIVGGGWELVRRVKQGDSWHPATDHLEGTEEYGTFIDDPQATETFSRKWADKRWNQLLFATGDLTRWVVVDKKELLGENYSDEYRHYIMSSSQVLGYTAKWNNRKEIAEDPEVGLGDADHSKSHGKILYVGNSQGGEYAKSLLHQGANVFIRSIDCEPYLKWGDTPGYCVTGSPTSNRKARSFNVGTHVRVENCAAAARANETQWFSYYFKDGTCLAVPECPYYYDCKDNACSDEDKGLRTYEFPPFYKVNVQVNGIIDYSHTPLILETNGEKQEITKGNQIAKFERVFNRKYRYNIKIDEEPDGFNCEIENTKGAFLTDVDDCVVACQLNNHSVSGEIKGRLTTELKLKTTETRHWNGDKIVIHEHVKALTPSKWTMPKYVDYKSTIKVEVETQPIGYTCEMSDNPPVYESNGTQIAVKHAPGSGNGTTLYQMPDAPVSGINTFCVINSYAIGGSLTKDDNAAFGTVCVLKTTNLNMENVNSHELVNLNQTGAWNFSRRFDFNSDYEVKVEKQPVGWTCTLSNAGPGKMPASDNNNVDVDCKINKHVLGGGVWGRIANTLVLSQGPNLVEKSITELGTFEFGDKVRFSYPYDVQVKTQPEGHTCAVANGKGSFQDKDIRTPEIYCTVNNYTIGGKVSGVLGAGTKVKVRLSSHGKETITMEKVGEFQFEQRVNYSEPYDVTVRSQPLGYTCTPNNAKGPMPAQKTDDVDIVCALNQWTIGGEVTGNGITSVQDFKLKNSATSEELPLNELGRFMFQQKVEYEKDYEITVAEQPNGFWCTVLEDFGGKGKMPDRDIKSLKIECDLKRFYVGGEVKGDLEGTLQVRVGAPCSGCSQVLNIDKPEKFKFPKKIMFDNEFEVKVIKNPAGYECTTGATGPFKGKIAEADVTNAVVTCKKRQYTLGGHFSSVGAFTGKLVVEAGGDSLTIEKVGWFNFAKPVDFKTEYDVKVKSSPDGFFCNIAEKGKGTMGAGNVNTVRVLCKPAFKGEGELFGVITGGNVEVVENVTLQAKTLTALGKFAFDKNFEKDTPYYFILKKQPTGGFCEISHQQGNFNAHLMINITCLPDAFHVSGNITGDLTDELVLKVTADEKPLSSMKFHETGLFIVPQKVQFGKAWKLELKYQPTGHSCEIKHGSGNMGSEDVTNVEIACEKNDYYIMGDLGGEFNGELTLQGTSEVEDIEVDSKGMWRFDDKVPFQGKYEVKVRKQSTGHTCTVMSGFANCAEQEKACQCNGYARYGKGSSWKYKKVSGSIECSGTVFGDTKADDAKQCQCGKEGASGTVAAADITDIHLECILDHYDVGGKVTGDVIGVLNITEKTGGKDQLVSITAPGDFKLPEQMGYGTDYSFAISATPTNHICSANNPSGKVGEMNVDDVEIKCVRFELVGNGPCMDTRNVEPRHCLKPGVNYQACMVACADKFWCNGFSHHPGGNCILYMHENQGQSCPSGFTFVYRVGNPKVAPQKIAVTNAWKCFRKFTPNEKLWLNKPMNKKDAECPRTFAPCASEACCQEANSLFGSKEGYKGATPADDRKKNPKGCYWDGNAFFLNPESDPGPNIESRQTVCQKIGTVALAVSTPDSSSYGDVNFFLLGMKLAILPTICMFICFKCCFDKPGDEYHALLLDEPEDAWDDF